MTDKTVSLSRQYVVGSKVFDSVEIREPKFSDLLLLGEPFELQAIRGGTPVVIENTDVVANYIKRCVIEPNYIALSDLGIADARKVREAVLGFFRHGEPDEEPSSKTSDDGSTISFSSAAGNPTA